MRAIGRLALAAFALIILIGWIGARQDAGRAMRHFQIGPYALSIPAAYHPVLGTPGDPRRSQYVSMIIPIAAVNYPSPPTVRGRPMAGAYLSLRLGGTNAERLDGYKDIPRVSGPYSFHDYTGYGLQSLVILYSTKSAGSPLYFVCSLPLARKNEIGPDSCNAIESVATGRGGASDLTINYSLREDYWPAFKAISQDLRSIAKSFVIYPLK